MKTVYICATDVCVDVDYLLTYYYMFIYTYGKISRDGKSFICIKVACNIRNIHYDKNISKPNRGDADNNRSDGDTTQKNFDGKERVHRGGDVEEIRLARDSGWR